MKIKEVLSVLESWAPPALQESYDNSGLLIGDSHKELTGTLITLDVTEAVVEEAISKSCNLIIAHHPIIFKGLKRLTGNSFTERVVEKAIRGDIAIYAIHTNLDNVKTGVNLEIAERLGIQSPKILQPIKGHLVKLVCFVPNSHRDQVAEAMFEAGAGHIGNYSHASFNTQGIGTFKGEEGSNPQEGKPGQIEQVEEVRLEVIVSEVRLPPVLAAMRAAHYYEEVAYDIYPLKNEDQDHGAGMIGELKEPSPALDILNIVKATFHCGVVKHTAQGNEVVKKIAWCGGSGSFLTKAAEASGADLFITGDIKYHDFFELNTSMILADIGHYESEQFTKERIGKYLQGKIPNFVPHFSEVNTNPVKYL